MKSPVKHFTLTHAYGYTTLFHGCIFSAKRYIRAHFYFWRCGKGDNFKQRLIAKYLTNQPESNASNTGRPSNFWISTHYFWLMSIEGAKSKKLFHWLSYLYSVNFKHFGNSRLTHFKMKSSLGYYSFCTMTTYILMFQLVVAWMNW